MNFSSTIRAARERDLPAALALVRAISGGARGLDRILELMDDAVRGTSGEYFACVAERAGECTGVGVYGLVAGTAGTAALYVLISADQETTGRKMLERMLAHLTAMDVRLVVAEFPGDSSFAAYRPLLEAGGFVEESRVADYFEDGIPLVQYRMEL